MDQDDLAEVLRLLSSTRSGDRLKGTELIASKSGSAVVRKLTDPRVVDLLLHALDDRDRRVQRAAARNLRPWFAEVAGAFDAALTAYAIDRFDGTYSHAGLLDTRTGGVWIPPFAAVKGHAALLRDANTDRYFKFELFVPGQAPRWIPAPDREGHLVLLFIPEWSYARQRLIPEYDERGRKAAFREQTRCADTVTAFYRDARLAYDVRVHRVLGGGGYHRSRECDIDLVRSGRTAAATPPRHESVSRATGSRTR